MIKDQVIYEDNHLLVINKLPGQLVQGDKTGDSPLLEELREYIRVTASKPGNVFIGLTHRLDRPCSGVVVYAKTSKALERMNAIFREGELEKLYRTVTESAPKQKNGTLRHFLKKNEKQNKSYVFEEGERDAKEAILTYRHLSDTDRYSLLEVELITGRHHQIRAQLSAIGCVVKGDLKYGAARSNKDGSIHLHAHSISFIHPVKKERFRFTASPPSEDPLWKLFSQRHSLCADKRYKISQNKAGCTENLGVDKISGDSVK